ncbi:hypothetical protein KP509_06G031400 [Ceratopteris richardii]|uniref:Uncharacterized protein n=1 Tax=Ceratopteris richardii TaxID=49495 RepID=A0A8T2UF57_CERRI|nr:hypothetical protein KP509_06G031400 [Ceratopteris richardii]
MSLLSVWSLSKCLQSSSYLYKTVLAFLGSGRLLRLVFPRAWSSVTLRSSNPLPPLVKVSSAFSRDRSFNRRHVVVAGVSIFWASVGTVAVAAASMSASMLSGSNSVRKASLFVKRGMQLLVQGNVEASLTMFENALLSDPRQKPYLWQRGLSLYYANRFAEGAVQFREDVAVNPNDTEESIWCFICEARVQGVENARKQFLEVGQDRRPVMQKAYKLFKDGGLYHEAEGNAEDAKSAILAACRTPYGLRSGDYMASLAKVHCKCRGWEL